jgi:hypothetical protein
MAGDSGVLWAGRVNEGRRKKEEGRRKKEEGRRKKEEGNTFVAKAL